ncbi:MAG TPA: trehalose-6-phosphate synthase [Candidatus Limnocylindrales bacterium]|nr:trehalose-6-phosphate synthase [Candidatus Limnocylindrales bacterium]
MTDTPATEARRPPAAQPLVPDGAERHRRARERHARLRDYLSNLLSDGERLTVVSNRGPLTFRHGKNGDWQVKRGSGGLVTALAELGRLAPITWISGAMDAGDRAAAALLNGRDGADTGRLGERIAEQMPGQDLRLGLTDMPTDAWQAHYTKVSNPFLWFVQHQLYMLPYEPAVDDELVRAWRTGYRVVNEKLALRAIEETRGFERPVVMLQDYHLYLAAEGIRAERPESLLLHFNHIPWPSVDSWLVLPQGLRRAICQGLLANDVVGLQTDRYATNFLQTVDAFVRDARVDPAGRHVRWRGRTIWVRAYPISIDPDSLAEFARSPQVARHRQRLEERLQRAGDPKLIVRVDRLEPSKNALRGFLAYEALLRRRPDLRRKVRFLAIQSSSREKVPQYADYAQAVREVVARVNGMADPDEQPIWLLDGSEYALAIAAMQKADVALVNPVVDGMNLVAKEAVVVGTPVLVLSETAGAAEQLAGDSLMVTAADVAGTSEMLERALDLPDEERLRRLRRLRSSVRNEDLAWWLARQLRDLSAIAQGGRPPSRALRDTVRRFDPELVDGA